MKILVNTMNTLAVIWFLAMWPLATYAIANVMQETYNERNSR